MVALERAARELGLGGASALRRGGAPWWLMRLLGPVVPLWREILDMRYLWETPHALASGALRHWLPGFRATPLPEALRASVQALQPALARTTQAA